MEDPGIDRELSVLMLEDTPSDAKLAERELRTRLWAEGKINEGATIFALPTKEAAHG